MQLRGFGEFFGSLVAINYRMVNATTMSLEKISLHDGAVETHNVTLNASSS